MKKLKKIKFLQNFYVNTHKRDEFYDLFEQFEQQNPLITNENDYNNHFNIINISYNKNVNNIKSYIINFVNNINNTNIYLNNYNLIQSNKSIFPKNFILSRQRKCKYI